MSAYLCSHKTHPEVAIRRPPEITSAIVFLFYSSAYLDIGYSTRKARQCDPELLGLRHDRCCHYAISSRDTVPRQTQVLLHTRPP